MVDLYAVDISIQAINIVSVDILLMANNPAWLKSDSLVCYGEPQVFHSTHETAWLGWVNLVDTWV